MNDEQLVILTIFYEHYEEFSIMPEKSCQFYFSKRSDYDTILRLTILYFIEYKFTKEEIKQMINQLENNDSLKK